MLRACGARRIAVSRRDGVSAIGRSDMDRCVVTSKIRRCDDPRRRVLGRGATISIPTSLLSVSSARSSVWPGWGHPAALKASLLIGAVVMAETAPVVAKRTATWIAERAALPASADVIPGRICLKWRATLYGTELRNAITFGEGLASL